MSHWYVKFSHMLVRHKVRKHECHLIERHIPKYHILGSAYSYGIFFPSETIYIYLKATNCLSYRMPIFKDNKITSTRVTVHQLLPRHVCNHIS